MSVISTTVSTPAPDAMHRGHLSASDRFVTVLIFLYWLLYEHIVFFYSLEFGGTGFYLLTNGIKLLLPLFLLLFTGLPGPNLLTRLATGIYCLLFAMFIVWSVIPTMLSGEVLEWLKLLPRAVFFFSVLAWFAQRPETFSFFAKLLLIYVLLALVQYVLTYATGAYESPVFTGYAYMAGPFGLFGNMSSRFYLLDAQVPFLRLAGFWNEPTHASACAFSGFFLGRYLVANGERRLWRHAAYLSLLAGLLTLSLAGYLALGLALLFGLLFEGKRLSIWRATRLVFLLPFAAVLLAIVVFGRSYVAENYPDNIWLRAIVGVRDSNVQQSTYDPTSGRMDIASSSMEKALDSFIGVGLQVVGETGLKAPESAPLLWLLLTGFPGLMLLLGREAALLLHGRTLSRSDPTLLLLVQALVAVMAQQLAYGSWMTPSYFILAAMVLVLSPSYRGWYSCYRS